MAGAREIPSRECEITAATIAAQARFFDLADQHGFTRKFISLSTGIPTGTLKDWANGTMMPLAGAVKIIRIKGLPNDIATLLIEKSGKSISDAEPDETDVDDAAIAALEYALEWARARHPASPSGTRIDHTEKPNVAQAGRHLADRAGKVGGA
ncbi:hypothetical protein EIK56_17980 [Sphingomonas sp. C8-2]|nr:hypothetical protein EIK56_17980 [Sphingomonas sp. C8-2]